MNKIELRLDVIFEKDINIGEVSKLLGKEPGFVLEKGKKYFSKRKKYLIFLYAISDLKERATDFPDLSWKNLRR